jgi:MtN3 and saliva related transmembrane protein
MIEIIGWVSSFVLLLTLIRQVKKQWEDKTSEGLSKWLFIGQLVASVGFTVYSYLVSNWVFTVTNGLLTMNNIFGIYLYFRFLKKPSERSHSPKTI